MFYLILFCIYFLFSPQIFSDSLKFYYSHSLNGNLHSCTCTAIPIAGLSRRHTFMESQNIKANESVLLELGDFFSLSDSKEKKLAILESFQFLGYEGLAVGKNEFIYHPANVWKNWKKFPILISNLEEKTFFSTKEIFPSPRIIQRKNKKIGLVSLYPENFLNLAGQSVSSTYVLQKNYEDIWKGKENTVDLWIFIIYKWDTGFESIINKFPKNSLLFGTGKGLTADRNGIVKLENRINLYSVPGKNGDDIGELEYDFSTQKIVKQKIHTIDVDNFQDSPEILKIAEKYGIKP